MIYLYMKQIPVILRVSTVLLFSFISSVLFAQQIPSQQIIEEAMESYDEGKYDLAIEQYRTIHENDSNYQWMLAELAMAYMAKGENDSAIMVADNGLKLKGSNTMHLLRTKGSAYDNKGESDKAIAIYKEAIEKFPYVPLLYFNLGITYYKLEKYEQALQCFQQSATGNPFHASSHRMLAFLAARQKMYTRALLSLETYLALEPNSNRSNAMLVYLENFSGNYLDTAKGQFIEPFIDNSLFEEVDHYLKAKIVLTDRYNSPIDFNANLVKQTQMVFDVLPLDQMKDDFWVKMYYPFFRAIKQEGHIVPFLYTLLLSTDAEPVQKYFSKNEKDLKAFYSTGSNLSYVKQERPANLDGEEKLYTFDYFDSGNLYSIGNSNENDEETGPWEYYFSNGQLQARGSFEKGEKVGDWEYYLDNGLLKSTESYNAGELIGDYIGYYDNGKKSIQIPYDHGEIKGMVTWYNYFGDVSNEVEFVDSKRNGKGVSYHLNGKVKELYNNKDSELTGVSYDFFSTGDTSLVESYIGGKLDGVSREYFMNGQLYAIGNYKEGNKVGEWLVYYSNGNLHSKANYSDEGKLIGEYLSYYHNGLLESKRTYTSEGKLDGKLVYYNRYGQPYLEETYSNDLLIEVASINRNGQRYAVTGSEDGTFSFVSYDINGRKINEGSFIKGQSAGKWKSYYKLGQLQREYEYVDGKVNGQMIYYHPNGQKSAEYSYENGVLKGKYAAYEKNGKIKVEGYYKNDQADDNWKYYNSAGELESMIYYLNGSPYGFDYTFDVDGNLYEKRKVREGMVLGYTEFDDKGELLYHADLTKQSTYYLKGRGELKNCEINTLSGMYHGDLTWYYPNGKVLSVKKMEIGRAHGKYKYFHENGKLRIQGNYFNGDHDGMWEYFYEDGSKKNMYSYYADEKDSICLTWHKNGQLKERESYFIGELQGDAYQYDEYGELMIKLIYDENELVAYQYNKGGDLCDTIFVKGPDYKIEAYFNNGQKSYEVDYKDFVRNGTLLKYDSKGQLKVKRELKDGLYNGLCENYYANGQLQSEYKYKDNLQEGEERIYYETGKLKKIINWKGDKQHGLTQYYNEAGKLTQEVMYDNGCFVDVKNK
ncbi:toxin-antitoxin system YwqK family antitoxin [Carboxylicivirga linearis]|nr:toxin-antitoxin system YwqK family antitoxin [Carboxylicivirga linearis]